MPFTLQNSGEPTELAYVCCHITCCVTGPTKPSFELDANGCWVSTGNYAAVLIKSGNAGGNDDYAMYVNVVTNQVLCSPNDQGISHVSIFECLCDGDCPCDEVTCPEEESLVEILPV